MGFVFGSGKKAAKIAAKATMDSAEMQAKNDRLMAQAAQQSRETMIAQDAAAQKASELLSVPQEQVEVSLGPEDTAEIDPDTGRRKSTRSSYRSNLKASTALTGLHI